MTATIAEVISTLEAERAVPVPRANRVAAVDVDDLALILDAIRIRADWIRIDAQVAAACERLELAVRRYR